MEIVQLNSLTEAQARDVQALMGELEPGMEVATEALERVVKAPGTHFFAAVDEAGRIAGCATLCVFETPTGRKAHVEDVVVSAACRGQHIGKRLLEHVIGFARRALGDVDLHLTSQPHRAAANNLYRSVGFVRRETNVYKLGIRASKENL